MELLQEIGMALEQQIDAGHSQKQIGKWAADILAARSTEIDDKVRSILTTLYKMEQEQGPDFEFTLDELYCLAQAMIYNKKDPEATLFYLASEREELALEKEDVDLRKKLGMDLKKLLDSNYSMLQIAQWAWRLYSDRSWASDTHEILLRLDAMEAGPEFELTREELYYLAKLMIDYEENPREKLRQKVREKMKKEPKN